MTVSSPATISSPTKTYVASCRKCPTVTSGPSGSAWGTDATGISVSSHAASPIATELRKASAPGLFMKEDDMNRLEKVLYTAKAHTTGGRSGISHSSDGRLEVKLSRPGSPDTGTNPEQLFAAGWSACFDSAMEFAARNMKITLLADHAVDAEIDLGPEGGGFSLAARLYVSLPGMERETAQQIG